MLKFDDLEEGFFFVNASVARYDAQAYVSRSTGAVYVASEEAEINGLPDDLDISDDYLPVPRKNELDLGVRLVWAFVAEHLPSRSDTVRAFFRRRGGYARFKDLLDRLDLLDTWHEFENRQTRRALLEWCHDNDLKVET